MPPAQRPPRRRWPALALLALAGCASAPPLLPVPEVETQVRWFPGSWLGEPRPPQADGPGTWQVLLRCRYLRNLPAMDSLPPALAMAELVTVEPTRHLLLPTSRFLADVRVATDLPALSIAA